jgi:hypothetical protein
LTLEAPPASGSAVMDNLLAAIAETVNDEAGFPPPAWTRCVPALEAEWAAPGTSQMERKARRNTPPRLAARGLAVSRDSLWRDRETVGG